VRGLGLAVALVLLVIIGAGAWAAVQLAQTSTAPLTFDAPSGDQRVLILGYGGGDHPGAYLSDSMLLLTQRAELSIPRDLWVQLPPNSGRYARINEALQDGYSSGGLTAGADLAAQKVQDVVGMPVTGWVLDDFDGFRGMVDALGGVDVDVQRASTAQYPVNDNPDVNASWKTVHFDSGRQHMDGEHALEYARARYSDDPLEGSDFARSARQQRLVTAIRQKLASPAGAVRFVPFVQGVAGAIHTNLSPTALAAFLAAFHPDQAKHVTLDNTNVLVDGRSPDGGDILLPRSGDYSLIATYVKSQLT
jgi:polyisoprenyl-teichoic acid--peptidoglycan teichoic acid transferase